MPNVSYMPNQKFFYQAFWKYTKIVKFGVYRDQLATLTNNKFLSEMPTRGHVTAPDL